MFFLPREPTLAVFGDFEFSSNRIVEPASQAISAQHRMEGIFIAKGRDIREGFEAEGMHVTDIAPLVLYLMDLPIPDSLDGGLPQNILTQQAVEARQPTFCKLEDLVGGHEGGRRSMQDESVKKRLKGLGYIS
jgi:hypothetical protein